MQTRPLLLRGYQAGLCQAALRKNALFRWPETGQLNSFVKNGKISLILGEGRQPLNILQVDK